MAEDVKRHWAGLSWTGTNCEVSETHHHHIREGIVFPMRGAENDITCGNCFGEYKDPFVPCPGAGTKEGRLFFNMAEDGRRRHWSGLTRTEGNCEIPGVHHHHRRDEPSVIIFPMWGPENDITCGNCFGKDPFVPCPGAGTGTKGQALVAPTTPTPSVTVGTEPTRETVGTEPTRERFHVESVSIDDILKKGKLFSNSADGITFILSLSPQAITGIAHMVDAYLGGKRASEELRQMRNGLSNLVRQLLEGQLPAGMTEEQRGVLINNLMAVMRMMPNLSQTFGNVTLSGTTTMGVEDTLVEPSGTTMNAFAETGLQAEEPRYKSKKCERHEYVYIETNQRGADVYMCRICDEVFVLEADIVKGKPKDKGEVPEIKLPPVVEAPNG